MMIMQNVDNHIERLVGEDYNYDDDYNKDSNDDEYDVAGSGQRHGKAGGGGGHGGAQFVLLHPIRSGEECANVGIIIIIIIVIIIVIRIIIIMIIILSNALIIKHHLISHHPHHCHCHRRCPIIFTKERFSYLIIQIIKLKGSDN